MKYTDYLSRRAALRDRLDAAYAEKSDADLSAVTADERALDKEVSVRWSVSERAFVTIRGDQIYMTLTGTDSRFQEDYVPLGVATPEELEGSAQARTVWDAWRHGQIGDLPMLIRLTPQGPP